MNDFSVLKDPCTKTINQHLINAHSIVNKVLSDPSLEKHNIPRLCEVKKSLWEIEKEVNGL